MSQDWFGHGKLKVVCHMIASCLSFNVK